jgi:apolipoprotein N-acyltransferase
MHFAKHPGVTAGLAALVSAVLLYFGTGLHPVWWLTWFAIVPVLVVAARLSMRWTFASAFTAWSLGGLNMWRYFHVDLEIPLIPVITFVVLPALWFGALVLIYRKSLRSSGWRAALILPTLWVSYEFVTARISPHSTFGNLGYTQMDFLPLVQLASITGIWGISFCLFLFAGTVGALLSPGMDDGSRRRLAAQVCIWLVLVAGFGAWRLRAHSSAQNTVIVGLVASDLRENRLVSKHDDTLRLTRLYVEQAEKLATKGAKVVVIPEKTFAIADTELGEVDAMFLSAARQSGAMIVVGLIRVTKDAKWNEARLYTPSGEIKTYNKHHMLPAFESQLTPGMTRTVWDENSARWGMAICKDMDFPALSRQYGDDGTALLLVPAWDFDSDGWLHGRMAVLRGVESGFTIARAPKQGVLAVTDDTGRVISERVTGAEAFTSLLVAAPVRHTETVYDRFGDWFAWLNVAIALWLLIESATRRRQA